MAKTENKTQFTDASVTQFIDAVVDDRQRKDARKITAMMEHLTGQQPKMYGPSIIGFGNCRYKYESGREGDMPALRSAHAKSRPCCISSPTVMKNMLD